MSEQQQPANPPEEHARTPGVSHESEAFDFRLIIKVGIGLAVVAVIVQFATAWLLGGLEKHHTVPPDRIPDLVKEDAALPLNQRVDNVPAPHLEGIERENISNSIAAARRGAEEQMGRYGWIDRDKEIVHIPVEKAMEQILRSKELGSPQGRERKRPEAGGRKR